ncbi:MAG: HD domain-containing protein [Chloroflexota bacterium]|nr:HD domain-containing protein [Chloroflexota bacterium]
MNTEKTMADAEVLAGIQAEVQRRFAASADPAHGWEHVKRVYELALHIAEQEGGDRFIVGAAALMHDLGRADPGDGSMHHAERSVELAGELLSVYPVPRVTQEAIIHAIQAHSYSRGSQPATLEAHILRDADRLDALGAIGIMRWAMTAATLHTPHNYHPVDPFAERRAFDDHNFVLDHFFAKLLKLSDTITTGTARALAEQRVAFMQAYLAEFKRELGV